MPKEKIRCQWAGDSDLMRAYHDTEWGTPQHSDRILFEYIVLDSFQAGLSWITIRKKRDNFRAAFAGFDPSVVAGWGEKDIDRLLADPGIIRHRGKIEATITNAQAWQRIEQAGGFNRFLWDYMDGAPLQNSWASQAEVPTQTDLSERISKDLKKAGFRFCGPTIVYAFMEAVGMVNDHVVGCHRHDAVAAMGANTA